MQKLKIRTVPSDHTYEVRLPSGSQFWDQRVPDLPIRIQEYEDALQCFVMKLEHVDLILGIEWFKTLDAKINWQTHVVSFSFAGTQIQHPG